MVIIYANSVPLDIVYTNINHYFKASDFKPSEAYINFWDNFALKHHTRQNLDKENAIKKVYESIDTYEKILSHIGIKNQKILYSDASNRLLRDRIYYSLFEEICSKITTSDLMKGFEIENLEYKDLTFANLVNIIIDYLVCVFIEDIYPNKKFKRPDIYLTSERFKVFFPIIEKVLKSEYTGIQLPYPHYVSPPFLLCPIEKKLPSLGMNKEEIMKILENYLGAKKIKHTDLDELIKIIARVLDRFRYNKDKISAEQFAMKMKLSEPKEIVTYLSMAFMDYYAAISKIIELKRNEPEESITISNLNDFIKKIRPLNNLKISILKLCNGNNSPIDIAKTLKLNPNTVAIYVTQLKKNNMITNESLPKRINDQITLNFREME